MKSTAQVRTSGEHSFTSISDLDLTLPTSVVRAVAKYFDLGMTEYYRIKIPIFAEMAPVISIFILCPPLPQTQNEGMRLDLNPFALQLDVAILSLQGRKLGQKLGRVEVHRAEGGLKVNVFDVADYFGSLAFGPLDLANL